MPDTNTLTPAQTAVARQHTYTLFSRLFLEGLTPELLAIVQQVPELATAVPPNYDPDEAAADHTRLFLHNLFPYESIFLDDSGLLGGRVTDGVTAVYTAANFTPTTDATSPDHIGVELAFMAHLCEMERLMIDGLKSEESERSGPSRFNLQSTINNQQSFLQTHLLHWLPPLVLAIRRQGQGFYAALADLVLAFVADHVGTVGARCTVPLPTVPQLLDNDKTSLKDIAAYLTTPCFAGMVIGRAEVTQLGRAHRLPRGFGDRAQLLVNLLRTAVSYDALPTLLQDLRTLLQNEMADYVAITADYPALVDAIRPWRNHCAATAEMLQTIKLHADEVIGNQ